MWAQFLRRLERFRQESPTTRLRRPWYQRLGEAHRHWLRIVLAAAVVFSLVWLFPRERTSEFSSWREGMVAPRDVIAPFSLNVRKNDVELEQDRARARNTVAPVVRYDPTVGEQERVRLMRFLQTVAGPSEALGDTVPLPRDQLHQQTIQWLLARPGTNRALARRIAPVILARIYDQGALSNDQSAQLRDYFRRRADKLGDEALPDQVAYIGPDGSEQLLPFSKLQSLDDVRDDLGEMITRMALASGTRLSSESLRALHNLIDSALQPNLRYDREETIRRQAVAAANEALYKRTIFKDERFIESHAVLTSDDIDELTSLMEAEQQRQRNIYRWQPVVQWFGRAAAVTAIIFMVGLYFREFHQEIWSRLSWLTLAALLIWLPQTVSSYAAANTSLSVYIVPLPLTAMLGTVLFGPQVGVALAGGAILIAGAILGFAYQLVFVNVIGSAVAAYSVRHVRNRSQFLEAMFVLPLAMAAAIIAVDAMQTTSLAAMWSHIWPGVVNGLAVPVLAMGLLVVFERIFGITTSISLLELSDLNSPLLRDLAVQAPGTYTHSLIIANLAENAAEAIGANALLARVGAYYHDIGKIQRPTHFVENQLYVRNPHDKLSPQMSALIVAAHVKDGIEIADKVGLPQQVIDFIPQHHGTLLISFFYQKAQQRYGRENVREEAYRYPGPKPQTREAAILMMADAVEAAARALRDRTPSRVQGMVHQLIKERLDDGQFDECDLTLRELERIEESFLPVLAGTLHERIEYPKAPRAQAESAPAPLPTPTFTASGKDGDPPAGAAAEPKNSP